MLNPNIMNNFRNAASSKLYDDYFVDRTRENIKDWPVILSCMDWIDVALGYINQFEVDDQDIDLKSIGIYSFISAVDIMKKSIDELFRILKPKDDELLQEVKILFEADRKFFTGRILELSDNEYFSKLRAAFGAHTTTFTYKEKSTEEVPGNQKTYSYAVSWPTDQVLPQYDLSVYLTCLQTYNGESDYETDKFLGVNLSELKGFIQKRYDYLEDIRKFI